MCSRMAIRCAGASSKGIQYCAGSRRWGILRTLSLDWLDMLLKGTASPCGICTEESITLVSTSDKAITIASTYLLERQPAKTLLSFMPLHESCMINVMRDNISTP